ncbi:MAG: hypothetical protein ACO4CI_05100 [Phycisphaerales bacterium]
MNLPNQPHQPPSPPVTEETVHDALPRRRGRIPGGHAGRGRFDPGLEHAIASRERIESQHGDLGIVWLDRHRATLLVRQAGGERVARDFENSEYRLPKATGGQAATAPAHLGGNPETHRRENREEWLHRYYDEIAEALEPLAGYVIAGPGPAKNELHRRLARRHGLEDRLLGMLAMPARVGESDLVEALDRFTAPS